MLLHNNHFFRSLRGFFSALLRLSDDRSPRTLGTDDSQFEYRLSLFSKVRLFSASLLFIRFYDLNVRLRNAKWHVDEQQLAWKKECVSTVYMRVARQQRISQKQRRDDMF